MLAFYVRYWHDHRESQRQMNLAERLNVGPQAEDPLLIIILSDKCRNKRPNAVASEQHNFYICSP